MDVEEGSDQKSDIYPHWVAAYARLKEFTEDEKWHISWTGSNFLIFNNWIAPNNFLNYRYFNNRFLLFFPSLLSPLSKIKEPLYTGPKF